MMHVCFVILNVLWFFLGYITQGHIQPFDRKDFLGMFVYFCDLSPKAESWKNE